MSLIDGPGPGRLFPVSAAAVELWKGPSLAFSLVRLFTAPL